MRIAVVGAGIAGLSAAHELLKAGHTPILFEPGSIGGMLRSEGGDGFTLELGPNVLVERPDMVRLLAEVGLTSEVRFPSVNPYGQFVWYRDRAVKVPAGLLEFIGNPLFSLRTKLALPFRLLRRGLLQPSNDDLSVLDFFTPLIGAETARALLDPVLKGIYGGDVADLSARSIFPRLWESAVKGCSLLGYMRSRPPGGKPRIMVIKGGIQRLTEELWRGISPRVEYRPLGVTSIRKGAAGGYNLVCSNGETVGVDRCVLTSAGCSLAEMLGELDAGLSARVRRQRYASLEVVHLSVPRSEPLIKDAFGVLFPGGMPLNLLGVMFNSLIFPHVAPADRHVLTVVLGGAQAGEATLDIDRAKRELPPLLTSLLGIRSIEWLRATGWSRAIPQLDVGHFRLVEALDQAEKGLPGIVFAGVDRGGVGVSDRIRIAREAVDRVLCDRQ